MNLILLEAADFIEDGQVKLTDRRFQHVKTHIKPEIGSTLKVGLLGGKMGQATIVELSANRLLLDDVVLDTPPPERLPLILLLGLPRPKMLKRIFQHVATLGIERLVLLNSYRVEKSFWQSPWLEPETIREQLILGLEQGRDTVLPEIIIEKRFKPFVEDRLPAITCGKLGLVADPRASLSCPRHAAQPTVLAIGPEGGWIPYEVEKMQEAGLASVNLGPRILRVDTAVTALAARLF